MNFFRLIVSLVFLCVAVTNNLQAQCGTRYYDETFTPDTTNAIKYGRNVKANGDTVDLFLDVYQPMGDTLAKRPLIIFAFGGSFTFGSRLSPDIVTLCNEFTARGYVCASIDYRLGFENGNDSDTNQLKAVFRGVQDMRAALRFFYKDASTVNEYRIDTNQIFIGGTSAGAFISLNHGYFKFNVSSRPVPPWAADAIASIGGVDGYSGNDGYSSNVKGIINLCGAIADTFWIQQTDPIIVSVHGTADSLVPFMYDSVRAAQSVEAMFFGSGDIHNRADHVGLTNHLKIFYGAEHAPFIFLTGGSNWQKYMDTTVWTIRDFLYDNLDCNSTGIFNRNENETEFNCFPNPASSVLNIEGNEKEIPLSVELFDISGRSMLQFISDEYAFTLSLTDLSKGIYQLNISEEKTGAVVGRKRLLIE